ncbi:hypothetical protein CPB83DRAFT_902453 [Crepidotus variabilis]|uniref:Uncharacterized protein n=1 Tax=Crepidotus variabilis TaxID=179855 RepID=A0A9P6ERQ9_9AGAR|nr:hypothetical protein CPB83DRAFT_902453 [Crepidotus variabilis]
MPPSSGLFSGVFNFVSKEFDSFVAGATGSSIAGPSTLVVFSDGEDDEYVDDDYVDGESNHEDLVEEEDARSPPRKRSKRGLRRRTPTPEARPRTREVHSVQVSSREKSHRRSEQTVTQTEDEEASDHSPSPPPLPRVLKRRPSMTMPGSLFPRSPSMEPEHGHDQRVRFASKLLESPAVWHSPKKRVSSREQNKSSQHSQRAFTPSASPPRRRNLDASVKAAVDRFHEDEADPSILLPSPQTSPHTLRKQQYSKGRKGKERAIEPIHLAEPASSGVLNVRGKEKELVAARAELDKNERRLEKNEADEPSLLEQIKQDRDRDKTRIKMLEEEIQSLKQELLKRSTISSNFPPPPPPPPPPPMRNIISIPRDASEPDKLFVSARSSLRHAPPPVENPINPLNASARRGKPTIGIPADKMAAFLKEMKTVRLRKVSDRSMSMEMSMASSTLPSSMDSSLRRTMSLNRSESSFPSISHKIVAGDLSLSDLQPRLGEKRKRTITSTQNDLPTAFRKRSEKDSSFGSNTSSNSMSPPLPPQSHPLSPRPTVPDPPSSVTDAPTPSLCSDNEMERDETSPDDQPPATPPTINVSLGPSRAFFRFTGNGIPVEPEKLRRSTSVQMNETSNNTSYTHNNVTPIPVAGLYRPAEANVFNKRLPTSPLPKQATRRPRSHVRSGTRTATRQPSPVNPHGSEEEDPLSLSFSSPENEERSSKPTRSGSVSSHNPPIHEREPSSKSKRTRGSGSTSSSSTRRLTLDEELQNANSSSPIPDDMLDQEFYNDENSSIYTGVGTRSKRRGFLAGGGPAGMPVFMGVGYVDGAIDEDRHSRESHCSDEEHVPSASRRSRSRR